MLTGSCHCESIRIKVDVLPTYLNQCHCSVCRRYGTLWGYYRPDQVHLLCGPDATEAYSWNGRNLEFHRCRSCGCVTHWTSTDRNATRMAINARLLDPSDLAAVPVRQSDGPPS
jgi:hypothetical protein